MKRLLSSILVAIMVLSALPLGVMAGETSDINVYFNGELIEFDLPSKVENGEIMVEMDTLFNTVGIEYDYNPLTAEVLAFFDNGAVHGKSQMDVKLGENKLVCDRVDIELATPFYAVKNKVMCPLDTICYIYNIDLDRSDLSNVQVNFVLEADTYDYNAEMFKALEPIEEYKTILIDENSTEFIDKAQRQKPETFREETIDVSDDETVPFDTALDWEVTTITSTFYDAQLAYTWHGHQVKQGDVFVVSFWAKGIFARVETGVARLGLVVEELNTWKKTIETVENLTPEWKQYFFFGTATKDMTDFQFCLRQHFCFQEIQIAGVQVAHYKDTPADFKLPDRRITYQGIEEDALWRKEAYKRIEKYRMNDMVVNVVDEDGNPIEGADVHANMTRHEFLWGINLSHYAIGPEDFIKDVPHYIKGWQDIVKELGFNFVVEGNAFKAMYINPRWVQDSYNWCIDNDFETRLHCLYWEGDNPTVGNSTHQLPEYRDPYIWDSNSVSKDEMRHWIENTINKLATFGQTTSSIQIDVVNEFATRHNYALEHVGFDETIRMFDVARQIMPNIKLYYTETNTGNGNPDTDATRVNLEYVSYLREMGIEFDGLGLQGHIANATYPQYYINTIDRSLEYADEVSILEYDMGTLNEAEKVPFTRDSLIACYSHPGVASFVLWQPQQSGAPDNGILWNMDGTHKAPLQTWKDTVMGELRTEEFLTTDANGDAKFRGHRGRYDITVKVGDKEETLVVNLTTEEDNNIVTAVVTDDGIKMSSPNLYVKKQRNYVNWKDYGQKTDVIMPPIDYKHVPETTLEDCKDADGVSLPHVLDENPDTFWRASNKSDYITIELGDSVDLKLLKIDWNDIKIKRYNRKIEVSEDGENWTTVSSGFNSLVDEEVSLLGHTGKYIRISGLSGNIAINDVEVFTTK